MRTTLTIDDDVLAAAKELANREGKSVGEVISELARQSLRSAKAAKNKRNGMRLLPVRPDASRVTPDLVNHLRDGLL